MDYRKAKSQPNLPQRIWSTSELPQIPRSHSLSTRQGGGLVDAGRDHQGARPLSSIPPRPESRIESRPQSRLGSRPQSRIGSSRPQQLLERPKSGVRPLSGRVFMRRTSERGWVAKVYPDDKTSSQTDVNLFDDLSDCESLDSFFDDDFDTEEKEEKLGNLLTCNTLGVESKGRRPDWVAGDVGIPKFHCPRCRDHWYGITPYPCDEELARLIREGLWYTGKDGVSKPTPNHGQRNIRRPTSGKREFESHSSESLTGRIPSLRYHNMKKGERSPHNLYGGHRSEGDKKKKRKRITFKLDNEDEETSDASTVGLDGEDSSNRGRGNTLVNGFSGGGSEGDGVSRGLRSNGVGGSDGTTLGGSSGDHNNDSHDGLGSHDNDSRRRGKRSDGQGDSSDDILRSANDGDSSNDKKLRRLKRDTDCASSSRVGGTEGKDSMATEHGSGSDSNGMGMGHNGLGGDNGQSRMTGSAFGTNSEHKQGERDRGQGGGNEWNNVNQRSSDGDQTKLSKDNLGSTSQVSTHNTSGRGSRRGSLHGALGNEDHGKNVRKAVGYMRAVSPTSSEWGDPLHARSFLSSTATSRSGSTTNLLRGKQQHDAEEDRARSYLPPIVPSIQKKQPTIDLSDLLDGFQLTRAWTFSYHNKV